MTKTRAGVRALAALALIAAGLGGVPAAPAAAGAARVGIYCFDVFDYRDDEIRRECIEIPLVIYRERCCPEFRLQFAVDLRDPAEGRRFVEELTAGLRLVVRAEAEGDPRLRDEAADRFVEAVHLLGSPRVDLTGAGPEPDPWLESAGVAVAESIALMWEATAGPSPEPWREQALASVDRALRALRYQAVG